MVSNSKPSFFWLTRTCKAFERLFSGRFLFSSCGYWMEWSQIMLIFGFVYILCLHCDRYIPWFVFSVALQLNRHSKMRVSWRARWRLLVIKSFSCLVMSLCNKAVHFTNRLILLPVALMLQCHSRRFWFVTLTMCCVSNAYSVTRTPKHWVTYHAFQFSQYSM